MPVEIRHGAPGEPFATRTCLGWAINGPVGFRDHHKAIANFISMDMKLDEQVKRFWEIENPEIAVDDTRQMSVNDRKAVRIWENSLQLDGHYQLSIPFKENPPNLQDNYIVAEQRLYSLGRRLLKIKNFVKNTKTISMSL